MGCKMDKRITFLIGSMLIILVLAGCSFNIQEMGLPFMPTSTNTLVPTPLPTATPTLLPKAPKTEGVLQTEILTDGSTRLTDTELGYTIVFPAQWLILGMDQDVQAQLAATFKDEIPENLQLSAQTLTSVAGTRAAALDYSRFFSDSEQVNTNIIVQYETDPTVLEEDFTNIVDETAAAIPTQLPSSNVIYQAVVTNSNGVEYGKLVLTHPEETFGVPLKQLIVFFKIGDGMVSLTGTALEEEYSRLEASFQRVVDSIDILD